MRSESLKNTAQKKMTVLALTVMGCIALTGCSLRSYAEQTILKNSGIEEDADYQSYISYDEEGLLDEDGYFDSPDWDPGASESTQTGSIPVTFADNNFFWINYYRDAAMEQLIDPLDFWVDPGDEIYAAEPLNYNKVSDMYRLAGFRIVTYDKEGRMLSSSLQSVSGDGLIIRIPNSFEGTEVAILPVGEYPDRDLNFSVYWIDDSGNRFEIAGAGTWAVNGKSFSGKSGIVSSMETYTIEFNFDDNDYFYISASPAPLSVKLQGGGTVTFDEIKPTEGISDFSVELHPCLSVDLWFAAGGRVSVNGQDPDVIFANEDWRADDLRYGDTLTVVSEGSVSLVGDGRHIQAEKVVNGEDVRYVLTITAEDGNADSFPEGLGTRQRGSGN